jgi:hypothetical protein
MSEWISVEDSLPEEGRQVLLYWKESGHIEDGAFYEFETGTGWYHVLFDGESLNCEPTHWMPLPEPPK